MMLPRNTFLLYLLTVIEVGNSFKDPTIFEDIKQERTVGCNVCAEFEDCSGSNTVCINGRCDCDHGYRRQADTCITERTHAGSLGSPCTSTNDCETSNSLCEDNKCTCLRTFVRVYNQCLPQKNHNETCEHRVQCGNIQYCSCDGQCSCITGYVFDEFVMQTCLPISARDKPCKVSAQCSYANAQCNDGICGCSNFTGRSLDSDDCVAMSMDFSVTMELKNVYYTPRLNDPMYRNIVLDLNELMETVIFNIETSGVNVESFSVHNITKNSLSGKADVTFSLTVSNPEYKRHSMGKTLGRPGMRRKRSIADYFSGESDENQNLLPEDLKGFSKHEVFSVTADVPEEAVENIKHVIIADKTKEGDCIETSIKGETTQSFASDFISLVQRHTNQCVKPEQTTTQYTQFYQDTRRRTMSDDKQKALALQQ